MDATEFPLTEIKRRLSWVEFLSPLSAEELDGLVERASFAPVGEGEVLTVGPGEHSERMLLLVAGRLQVYQVSPSGRELTLSVLGSGSPVSATGLIARWTRDLYVRALEPSLVCSIEHEYLEALVERNPRSGLGLARTLAAQLILMEDRWADAVEKEVRARLAALLLMLAEGQGVMTSEGAKIPTRYTHQQLGSMIGSNREAVTRAFADLQDSGCVEVRNRVVYVKDFDVLRRCAGA